MVERRRWEDLNADCLVNVLERVGMESLILDVPFVCKSWYRASLNPECWKILRFSDVFTDISSLFPLQFLERFKDEYRLEKFSITGFVKLVVSRSRRSSVSVFLPSFCSYEALELLSYQCPALKVLGIPSLVVEKHGKLIVELVSKCKGLQQLYLGSTQYYFMDILCSISFYCKDFNALSASGDVFNEETLPIATTIPKMDCLSPISNLLHLMELRTKLEHLIGLPFRDHVCNENSSAIVTFLPKIKYLWLRNISLPRESLKIILEGCKDLVLLDARDCFGFQAEDEEILKMASHIKTFMVDGSRVDLDYGGVMVEFLPLNSDDDDADYDDGGGGDDDDHRSDEDYY